MPISAIQYEQGDHLSFGDTSETSNPIAFSLGRISFGTTASTIKPPAKEFLSAGCSGSGRTRTISMGIARSCLIEPGDEVRINTILSTESPAAEGDTPFDWRVAKALAKERYKPRIATVIITSIVQG